MSKSASFHIFSYLISDINCSFRLSPSVHRNHGVREKKPKHRHIEDDYDFIDLGSPIKPVSSPKPNPDVPKEKDKDKDREVEKDKGVSGEGEGLNVGVKGVEQAGTPGSARSGESKENRSGGDSTPSEKKEERCIIF